MMRTRALRGILRAASGTASGSGGNNGKRLLDQLSQFRINGIVGTPSEGAADGRASLSGKGFGKRKPLDCFSTSDVGLDVGRPLLVYHIVVALLRWIVMDLAPASRRESENSSDGYLRWLGVHQQKIEQGKPVAELRRGGGPVNAPFKFSDPYGILRRKPKTQRQGKPIPKAWFQKEG
jgi:hypothetical protein